MFVMFSKLTVGYKNFKEYIESIDLIYVNADKIVTISENKDFDFKDDYGEEIKITSVLCVSGDNYRVLGTPEEILKVIYKTEKSLALIEEEWKNGYCQV